MKEEIIRRITLDERDVREIIAQKYDVHTYDVAIDDEDLEVIIETPLKTLQHKDKEDFDRLVHEHKVNIAGFYTEE